LIDPGPVAGGLVLITAGVGIVVNVAAAWAISKANRSSLNVEGAFQHILTDLYGFIATAVAGLVVLLTGFARADAIASLVVVVLMLRAGTGLVRDAGRIFLEAAPSGVDPDSLGDRLVALPNVNEVHDLHVWQITSGQTALSAHVLVEVGTDCHGLRRDLEQLLADDYSITHTTLQVDHTGAPADPTPADAQLLPLAERRRHPRPGPPRGPARALTRLRIRPLSRPENRLSDLPVCSEAFPELNLRSARCLIRSTGITRC
jgi:cobalt-zinc-cadmium efflux system protein